MNNAMIRAGIFISCFFMAWIAIAIVSTDSGQPIAESVSIPADEIENTQPSATTTQPTLAYTSDELEILAIIIYQEAGSDLCSDETRQMVGEVFLNRVASSRYPDTFLEVATQRAQYGRLYWTGLKWPDRADSPQEKHAVARAYAIAKTLLDQNVERLLPEDTVYQAEFKQGTEVVVHLDNFYFCR